MSHKKPTKRQQDRLDRLHRLPCMACVHEGVTQPNATEAHHLVDKGYREHSGGHDATIPLCEWHHRGVQREAWGVGHWLKIEMEAKYGPSMALNKRAFEAKYGTQRELLAKIDVLLGLQRMTA